jgi:radical SAM protein with 4Fe4S-binding SPASM domain
VDQRSIVPDIAMTTKSLVPVVCSKPWTSFEVEHDGRVAPCCMSKVDCGNINSQAITEIWNGPAYQEFRRKMAAGEWQDTCRPECPRLHGSIDDSVGHPLSATFRENYQRNVEEIERRALVLESLPRIWKVTASTRCNLDCIMCYQERTDLRSLPLTFYEQLEPMYGRMQEMQILGGEPFAIRRVRQFLQAFPTDRYPDARIALTSNGTIHDEKTIALARTLRVSWMSISIDAATDATYAHIRRGGDLATTLRGARRWIDLGRERGFPVHIAFTVMRDNVDEIAAFVELARDLGVDALFGTMNGTKADQHLIDSRGLRRSIARAREIIASATKPMPLADLTLSAMT